MTTVFPLGHPVEIASSNSKAIAIAESRWASPDRVFGVEPLRFSIEIVEGEDGQQIGFRPGRHGFSYVGSGCGFYEVQDRVGTIRSTLGSLEQMMESTILTALTWTFFIGVHAGCVMRGGRSVLLCGDSGAGKSTLTFACGLAGWAVVSDNSLYWTEAPYDVLVSPGASVKLREGARRMFGEKADTPLETETLAPRGPLVFLERRPGSRASKRKPLREAVEYLEKYDTRPDREHARDRYTALLQEGAWTLEYEHVEDAVAWLGSLT